MMGLWDLGGMAQALPQIFGAKVALVPLDPGPYGAMAYPRWLPLLKFQVQWYGGAGYGNVFAMHTRALGGRMELATLVFTPNVGGDVPLLLVDVTSSCTGKSKTPPIARPWRKPLPRKRECRSL